MLVEFKNLFVHHPPTQYQIDAYSALRASALGFATAINALVPEGAEKDEAIMRLRESLMLANAGIACADPCEDYTEFGAEGCISAHNCHQQIESYQPTDEENEEAARVFDAMDAATREADEAAQAEAHEAEQKSAPISLDFDWLENFKAEDWLTEAPKKDLPF